MQDKIKKCKYKALILLVGAFNSFISFTTKDTVWKRFKKSVFLPIKIKGNQPWLEQPANISKNMC